MDSVRKIHRRQKTDHASSRDVFTRAPEYHDHENVKISRHGGTTQGFFPKTESPAPIKARNSTYLSTRLLPTNQPTTLLSQLTHSSPIKRSPRKQNNIGRFLGFILVLLLIFGVSWAGYFLWKITNTTNNITIQQNNISVIDTTRTLLHDISTDENTRPLLGEEDGRINILLLGKASSNYPGKNLTDTIMIASINTRDHRVALFSLPRDLYVRIPDTHSSTKINALYSIGMQDGTGADLIMKSVSSITRLPLHYFIIVDYSAFVRIIDTLGGINITSEIDIYDTSYPGPNYSYQTFQLSKGFHKLDGETALKYVRERHSDPEGDFGRAKRQQQVIEAVRNKALTLGTILNPFTLNDLLTTLSDTIKTNITLEEIKRFLTILDTIDTHNINNVVIDAWKPDSLLRVSRVQLENGQHMFTLIPRAGNYSEIQESAATVFDIEERLRRKDAVSREKSSVALINASGKPEITAKVQFLLRELGFTNVRVLSENTTATREQTIALSNDTTRFPYSLDEVIKKIPATLQSESPENSLSDPKVISIYDIVLLLGKDSIPSYDWEEASYEELQNSTMDNTFGDIHIIDE